MVGGVCAAERSRPTSRTMAAPATRIMPVSAARGLNVSPKRQEYSELRSDAQGGPFLENRRGAGNLALGSPLGTPFRRLLGHERAFVAGRRAGVSYAQDCVVVTPLISFLVSFRCLLHGWLGATMPRRPERHARVALLLPVGWSDSQQGGP